MRPEEFEPYEEARERYIETKIEPILDTYRLSDQDWFSDFNRRKGEAMHASDLISRVLKLNPHVIIQQQYNYPDEWGMYAESLGRLRYLSGFSKSWMTEFSWTTVDDRNLPVDHRKGWRTVLVELLSKGALEWGQVEKEFGDPADGFNDGRWHVATENLRLGSDRISQQNIANSLE